MADDGPQKRRGGKTTYTGYTCTRCLDNGTDRQCRAVAADSRRVSGSGALLSVDKGNKEPSTSLSLVDFKGFLRLHKADA
jgi:hypothetical protein